MRKRRENEFGARIDRNGYADSIIPDHGPGCCWNCHRNGCGDPLNRHEVFGGPLRSKSKRLGLWVYLCHDRCHQGSEGVHDNIARRRRLQQVAQRCAMDRYGWSVEDFIQEFGRNYLED